MIIRALNPETENWEKTYLDKAISSGVTSFVTENAQNLSNNDRIMLGEMGREHTEVRTVSSVSGTTVTVTAPTSFAHDTDDPIYEMRYDQVRFYRADSLTGTYSALATVDIDVDNADLVTNYDDTTGTSTNYYKVDYYHSVSTQVSSLSDPIPGTGFTRGTVGKLIDEVLSEVGDENEIITNRKEILSWFNEVSDDLQTRTRRPYDFLKTRTTLTRTTNRNYIDFPTGSDGKQTMWKFDRMDYNYTDTTTDPDTDETYTLRVISPEEFRNTYQSGTIDSTTVNDQTQIMALDTAVNRFRFHPPFETTGAGVFYLYYWKFFGSIDSEGDEFETPNQRVYKLYALARFYSKQSAKDSTKSALADRWDIKYEAEVRKYTQHNLKDAGSPRAFSFRPQNYRGYRQY